MMTTDMRTKPAENLKDLVIMNYSIVVYSEIFNDQEMSNHASYLEQIDYKERPNLIKLEGADYQEFFAKSIGNDSLRLAFFIEDQMLLEMSSEINSNPIVMKEAFLRNTAGLGFHRNCFLFALTEDVFSSLIAFGVPQHVFKFHQEHLYRVILDDPLGPQVLKISDLSYGFIIWLITCGISTAAFLIELTIPLLGKLRDLIGLAIFNYFFKNKIFC